MHFLSLLVQCCIPLLRIASKVSSIFRVSPWLTKASNTTRSPTRPWCIQFYTEYLSVCNDPVSVLATFDDGWALLDMYVGSNSVCCRLFGTCSQHPKPTLGNHRDVIVGLAFLLCL